MAENRPYEAQEPDGRPSGAHLDAAHGPTRNRPATGAREAHSPHAADSGWQPGLGATDFLGLEPEVRSGEAGASGTTESWLFDIEQGDNGMGQPNGAYAEPDEAATAVASEYESGPGSPMGDFEGEYPSDPAADEDPAFAEGLDAEGLDAELAPARGGSTRILVGAALCCLIAVGGWYGWQRFSPRFLSKLSNTEVATQPTTAPGPRTPKPTPAKPSPQPVVAQPAAQPTEAAQPAESGTEVAGTETPAMAPAEPTMPSESDDPIAQMPTVLPTPVELSPTPVAAPDPTLARSPNAVVKEPELPMGEPGPGGGRHATDLDWAGMWLETTIPVDAIRGPTRLRTLNVGLVRAELVNGEFVEGRLQAVGESRIWLDVKLGRIAFDVSEVRHLVQIVGEQGQPLPLGTPATAGLPRVEVLLPGGSLTGRVLSREGDRVTFLTEEGMRVRVDAIDIRPAPNGRSRLVGRVADHKP